MPKKRDLWSQDSGAKALDRPQRVYPTKGWDVAPEVLPINSQTPRRRKYAPIRPNARDAVSIPLPGQSYNPRDEDHQAALAKAVKALEKKKRKDAQFVKVFTMGRDWQINSNLTTDKNWEEENDVESLSDAQRVKAVAHNESNAKNIEVASTVEAKNYKDIKLEIDANIDDTKNKKEEKLEEEKKTKKEKDDDKRKKNNDKKTKKKKKKKINKLDAQRETRRSLTHRRHPKRDLVVEEVEELDELVAEQQTRERKQAKLRHQRRAAKKANLSIKHYGRHYFTAPVVDVAPSEKLVGSLRHLSGSYLHPAMERMKSLEERNLVPARMRHTYNKRKVLKPKSTVRVKRESVGVLPTSDFEKKSQCCHIG